MLIRDFLKKKELTQRAFADKLGITVAFLNSILNGKNTDVKISLVRRIHGETGLDESKLITELLSHKEADVVIPTAAVKPKKRQ